jgi:hypothetical protein
MVAPESDALRSNPIRIEVPIGKKTIPSILDPAGEDIHIRAWR